MKPEDILQAIGDVDEAYVRRAHRKDCIKAILAFLATFALLVGLSGFWMVPDYVMTRFTPEGDVNIGYVHPDTLTNTDWTTLEITFYENGEATGTTTVKRRLFGEYTVQTPDATYVGVMRDGIARDYLETQDQKNLYIESRYEFDTEGRAIGMTVHGKQAYTGDTQLLNRQSMAYSTGDLLLEHTKLDDSGILGYQEFSYRNGDVWRITERDSSHNRRRYSAYVYEGQTRYGATFLSDGTVQYHTVHYVDWFGNITRLDTYQPDGSLYSTAIYRYRFWERYRGIQGTAVLLAMLSLSAAIGFGVYDDRIRFPKKQANTEH